MGEIRELELRLALISDELINTKHERDEALNQLDSAKHSISVLEKRVLQSTKQRDASLILNKFYNEDRKQRDKLLEAGEARIEEFVKERDDIREAALREAADAAQRGAAIFDVRMRDAKNWNDKRDWQSMLYAALDIQHAILALIGEKK